MTPVERVALALRPYLPRSDANAGLAARAAITALAEAVNLEMGVALEAGLSEGDGGRDLSGNYKLRALSKAILAALEQKP